jgi:hypothetical protein
MSLVNSMDDASSSDEALMRELFALTGEDEEEETDLSIQPVPTPDAGAIAQYVTIIPPDKSKVTPAVMAVSEPLTPAVINAVEQSQEDGTKEQERAEYGLAYGVWYQRDTWMRDISKFIKHANSQCRLTRESIQLHLIE